MQCWWTETAPTWRTAARAGRSVGGVDGIGVLETAKEKNLKIEVILITAHGSIDNAIVAMKKGAVDYLQKPINFDELFLRLAKIHRGVHTILSPLRAD